MKYQFAEYKNAALNEPTASATSRRVAIAVYTTAVTSNVTNAAGSSAGTDVNRSGRSGSNRGRDIAQQQLGNQESRQDEEHVDADVAAGEPVDPGVEHHHEVHRDRSQAVEMRTVLVGRFVAIFRSRLRFGVPGLHAGRERTDQFLGADPRGSPPRAQTRRLAPPRHRRTQGSGEDGFGRPESE